MTVNSSVSHGTICLLMSVSVCVGLWLKNVYRYFYIPSIHINSYHSPYRKDRGKMCPNKSIFMIDMVYPNFKAETGYPLTH